MIKASVAGPAKFDPALEGLRGLACLIVLLCHFMSEGVDPHFRLPGSWVDNLNIAREAVLIFFLISGYVIGLVSLRDYSPKAQRNYLWKRFVRLVPLYWLAILVSVVVYPVDSWKTIIPQFFFLQNTEPYLGIRLTVLKANYNLWSLNYEIVYYLTFLLVWRIRPGTQALGTLIFILVALGFTGWIFPHAQPKVLTGYAVGGAFWYTGLWMVWYGRKAPDTETRRWPWISIWLLLIVTTRLGPLNFLMRSMGLGWPTDPDFPFISFRELQVLPIGLIILTAATRRQLPLHFLVWSLALAQPLLLIGWCVVVQNQGALHGERLSLFLMAVALICWPLRVTERWLTWLFPTGLISYGIYIFARPVQWYIFQHFERFSGTWPTYLARCGAALALAFLAGYVAEMILQPRARAWLDAKFRPKVIEGPKERVVDQTIS